MNSTADTAVLDDFLNRFRTQVDAGFGLIQGDVAGVLGTLVVISIAITAILWAIDENQNVLAALVRKTLLVGFFAWLVTQWHTLSSTVVNGFAALGLKAGGGSMDVTTFTQSPSKIVLQGITVIAGLFDYIKRISPGPIEFFSHIDIVVYTMVAAIGILIAFVILAVEIVVTIIEFHIVTLVAFVTVPFGVLTQTSFMSERAIGYVVSVGMKMMALGLVVSLGSSLFEAYKVSPEPGIQESMGLLLAAVVMVMLALKIPALAAALITGGPQLNAGSAVMGAAGVAAGVAGGALAVRALGGAIAGAAGGSQVASARSAAGAIPSGSGSSPQPPPPSSSSGGSASDPSGPKSGGSGPRGGSGSGSGAGPTSGGSSTSDTLRTASRRTAGEDAEPPAPPPADTVARAEARRGPGLNEAVRTTAAAAFQPDQGGPGMSATPSRRPDDEA